MFQSPLLRRSGPAIDICTILGDYANQSMNAASAKARSIQRAAVIKALAHPSRVLIAEALIDGERCVCELTDLVKADMSTVSKHLAIMKAAGLVEVEKRGLNQFYRLRCPCLLEFFRCVDLITRTNMQALQALAG
jgi:DNA-binding transcriptional ArsR family regulator